MKHARPPFYCPALVGLITLLIYWSLLQCPGKFICSGIGTFYSGADVVDIDRNYSIK